MERVRWDVEQWMEEVLEFAPEQKLFVEVLDKDKDRGPVADEALEEM
jgi:hypothetical protein